MSADLPGTWNSQPIGSISRVLVSTVDKKEHDGEQSVRLANYTDVYYNDEIVDDLTFMVATASNEQVAAFSVRANDVAITKDSETSNDIGISAHAPRDLPGVVWGYHLAVYRPFDSRYARFIKRLFDSTPVKVELEKRTPGVTRVGLSSNTLRYLRVPVPPPEVAEKIADYLDRETAEIDAFIADQEELIALLEERRGSVIAAATTRSSTQSEWTSIRASRLVSVTLGKMLDQGRDPEAAAVMRPYIRAGNIGNKSLDTNDLNLMAFTNAEVVRLDIRAGDLLVVEGGSVGLNYYCEVDLPGLSFQKTVNRVRSRGAASAAFFGFVLDSMRFTGALDPHVNRSTISHLTAEKLERIVVDWPSPEEQLRIVERLNGELVSISAAVADAREAIKLFKERRAALISAAVTGQIDVTEKKRVLV